MVNTVRLASASADLDIMRETCLGTVSYVFQTSIKCLKSYSHSGVEGSCNLVVLLQSRTAAQDFGKPELAYSPLHVANLALSGWGSFDPLRWFSTHAAYHVGMSQRLGGSLSRLDVKGRWDRLGDSGMEGGGTAGNSERMVALIASGRSVARSGPDED